MSFVFTQLVVCPRSQSSIKTTINKLPIAKAKLRIKNSAAIVKIFKSSNTRLFSVRSVTKYLECNWACNSLNVIQWTHETREKVVSMEKLWRKHGIANSSLFPTSLYLHSNSTQILALKKGFFEKKKSSKKKKKNTFFLCNFSVRTLWCFQKKFKNFFWPWKS